MRSDYSLLSQELNDRLLLCYDYLIDLLGFEEDGYNHYSGIYEQLEASGEAYMLSQSGIPTVETQNIIHMLKFDYIYRTHYNQIRYMETK